MRLSGSPVGEHPLFYLALARLNELGSGLLEEVPLNLVLLHVHPLLLLLLLHELYEALELDATIVPALTRCQVRQLLYCVEICIILVEHSSKHKPKSLWGIS